jgi:carboxyl-terminal processing protease
MIPDQEPQATPPSDNYWRRTRTIAIGLLIALSFFAAGILAERNIFAEGGLPGVGHAISSLGTDTSPDSADLDQIEEVRDLLNQEYFYRPTDSDSQKTFNQALEYNAIRGMTDGLDDDYTTFLPPAEQAPVAEQMAGEYEGIGVWVDSTDNKLTIVAPMAGSPAEAAGLQAGDVILTADGHSLAGLAEADAIKFVRGPAGSKVHLTVRRPGVEQPLQLDVERQKITMPAVTYKQLDNGKVGYIQVTIFGDKTTGQLDAAIKQAQAGDVDGIILDLRNNGGGWVTAAQEMIGRFVPAEKGVALYEDDSVSPDNQLKSQPILNGSVKAFDIPLIVLVNDGTASAAEIVAGALQDYGRAKIVGVKTFGKGSVQRVHNFPDGSSVRITFALWLTPSIHVIQKLGIQPDVVVQPAKDQASKADPQLEKAVTLLDAGT